jgi:hypothetical protein
MGQMREVRQRRESLYRAMLALENAVASPVELGDEWHHRVEDAAEHLRELIDEHTHETERPGGFLDRIVAEEPRLAKRVERLAEEHVDLQRQVGHVLRILDDAAVTDLAARAEDVRDEAMTLLAVLARHRQRGADLIYEAYEVDIGESG